jgi:hypothetical protein
MVWGSARPVKHMVNVCAFFISKSLCGQKRIQKCKNDCDLVKIRTQKLNKRNERPKKGSKMPFLPFSRK